MKMHDKEVDIDAELVGRLLAAQFPQLVGMPIREVQPTGTVNAIYRLGDHLYARLPRVHWWAADLDREWHWLPELAPQLSLPIPQPVGKGHPTSSYPFAWAIYRWIDGQPYADELIEDERQAARELAQFVVELRRIAPVAGAPPAGAGVRSAAERDAQSVRCPPLLPEPQPVSGRPLSARGHCRRLPVSAATGTGRLPGGRWRGAATAGTPGRAGGRGGR